MPPAPAPITTIFGRSAAASCGAHALHLSTNACSGRIESVYCCAPSIPPEAIVDLGVALVPEGRRLFPKLTVTENLMLGAFRKAARSTIDSNLALVFETFPVLKERRNQLAGTMSGGQQQMLAIARAIMSAPRLLLVDEPSVGLSPVLVKQMVDTIAALKERYEAAFELD